MRTEALLDRELQLILRGLTEGNALVCQVCLHTGLRVSDVLALRREQIRPNFWVTEHKTGKRKQVGLPDGLRRAILSHSDGSQWAFPGLRPDRPRTRQAVWADIHRTSKAFKIRKVCGTHSMRKTYAQDVLRDTGDLTAVQRALNHDNELVTLLYVMAAWNLKKGRRPARRRRK